MENLSTNGSPAGNVADYRMFKPVLSVSLPVPVNLIFIGFDGDGAQCTIPGAKYFAAL